MRGVRSGTKAAVLCLAAVAAMSALSACSDDEGSGESGRPSPPKDNTPNLVSSEGPDDDLAPINHQPSFEPDYNNLTAQPWVEPTTPAQTDGVVVYPDRLVFPDTLTEIADWEPGRLVVSGPGKGTGKNPWGFARRVVKVEHVASTFVVTTSVAAIEDVLQGDFQMQLKPEALAEVDLAQADLEWVADNLYFQSEEADLLELEPLSDDWPEGQEPLGFWKKLKKKVGGAAKALAGGAVDLYKKVTPATVSGSLKLSPTLTLADQSSLFAFNYTKDYQTKKVPYSISVFGSGSYDASLTMKPGVQVGAKIALPGKGAKSSYWVNVDSSLALALSLDFNLATALTYNGKSGDKLADELENDAVVAQLLLGEQRKKLTGDPDMRPMGGWKKTLWISKPMNQTFAAGPVPVVLVETFQIDMECGFMAKAGISGKLELEQNATMKFSVRTDQATAPPQFNKTKKSNIQVTGGGELSVYCGLVPRVNVFLYDTIGLFAGVRGSLVAKAAYESICKPKPTEWWPDGKLTVGLYGNVGVRAGARVQAPGSSFLGKAGQKLGVEADLEPWNTEFKLLEKKWDFPVGLGYCLPTCKNLGKDAEETDADCGGPSCDACQVGASCKVNSDCKASVCAQGKCSNDLCADTVWDGDETDIDCGGPKCGKCSVGKICSAGSDCQSGYCSAWTTAPPVCVATHCDDGVKDGDEGGLDCGGSTCPKCAVGRTASSASDCESGAFNGTICVASDCFDLGKSGDETDVDCGGAKCPQRCGLTEACQHNGDCAKGLSCHATQNVCLRGIGGSCTTGSECVTGICQSGACASAASQCKNGTLDGAETDVDCGGPDCPKCAVLQQCMGSADCLLGDCQLLGGGVGGTCATQPNLLAAWQFDGNGNDASGNGHHLTLGSGVSFTSQAHSGSSAASFDGSASNAFANAGVIALGDKLTIASWLYAAAPVLATINPLVSSAASFSYPYDGLTFFFNAPESSDLSLGFETGDGSTTCALMSSAGVVKTASWQHLAVTVDRLAGTATLYLDGTPVAATGCVSKTFGTVLPLVLGNLGLQVPLKASLDDFRIYGAALSASEVAALAKL